MNDSLTLALESQIDALDCEQQRIMNELLNLQKSSDANLMQLMLQYFNIMKDELIVAKDNLIRHALECNLQKRQAEVLKDMKIFAHYLYLETKGKVSIKSLDSESSQFKRCRKAVQDNVSNVLLDRGYNDVKILHVFKLEHKILSSQLQKAAAIVDDGKVKGLFCVVPKTGLHSMSAFGLHAQAIPTENGPTKVTKSTVDSGIPNLFQVSWIWAELSESEELNTQDNNNKDKDDDFLNFNSLTVGRGAHYAENLAREGLKAFSPSKVQEEEEVNFNSSSNSSSSSSSPKDDKARKRRTSSSSRYSFQKFSRSSTPSGLTKLSSSDLEEGCFVTLCRVLISKYRTITGTITDSDVMESINLGYDSIYSSSTEEYVLLKPQYVLPEFIMHLQMQKDDVIENIPNAADTQLHSKTEAWLPQSLVVPKPVRQSDSRGNTVDNLRRSSITEGLSSSVFSSSIPENLAQNETQAKLKEDHGNGSDSNNKNNTEIPDSRVLLMQKQAILLSIDGAVDEFVRHMRDLLVDCQNPSLVE